MNSIYLLPCFGVRYRLRDEARPLSLGWYPEETLLPWKVYRQMFAGTNCRQPPLWPRSTLRGTKEGQTDDQPGARTGLRPREEDSILTKASVFTT